MKRSDLLNEIDRAPGTSGTSDDKHTAAVIGAGPEVRAANLGGARIGAREARKALEQPSFSQGV